MIIDSHAHLYPATNALGDWDFKSEEGACLFHQRTSYAFHRSARRSDMDIIDSDAWKLLWDEGRVGRWDGRIDVGFRIEGGNFVWEKAGITYTSPCRPGSDPTLLVSLMDACGVDAAVLQTPLRFSRFGSRMAQAYPGRFLPLALIDESEYATARGVQELHKAVEDLGMKGIYHNPYPAWDCFENFDGPQYGPFWQEVAALGIPVWCLGTAEEHHFPGILPKLRAWIEHVPAVTRIMVHGFPPSVYLEGNRVVIPEIVKRIVGQENFYMELLPQAMGYYTHPRSDDIVHALYDAFGGTKFVWGSEFIKAAQPHTKEHYAEMMGYFDSVCTYMSKQDAALIRGENLRRVFRLSKERAHDE